MRLMHDDLAVNMLSMIPLVFFASRSLSNRVLENPSISVNLYIRNSFSQLVHKKPYT
jgi:hypothetical protein